MKRRQPKAVVFSGMIELMKIIALLFLFLALTGSVYASVHSQQRNAFEIFPITDPSVPETYYGSLSGSPHTYQFLVQEKISFKAVLSTASKHSTADDLSLIIVKEEKRGVSEVGRVTGKDTDWNTNYSHSLALRFRESQSLDVELDSGVYRLEVSTPVNLRSYKLELNEGGRMSYKELFMARSIFDLSYLSVVFTIRVYVPLLILFAFIYYRKNKKRYVS